MSKVFFDVGVSLDGYIAGPNRGPGNPLGDGGVSIHNCAFKTAHFLERIGLPGGETSPDDDLVKAVLDRAGAHVLGRRMFDEGEAGWPENPPFRAPVFVLTHSARQPWRREGGTTLVFVIDGIVSALELARVAAAGKDVRVAGGADTIRQFIRAGSSMNSHFTLPPLSSATAFDCWIISGRPSSPWSNGRRPTRRSSLISDIGSCTDGSPTRMPSHPSVTT